MKGEEKGRSSEGRKDYFSKGLEVGLVWVCVGGGRSVYGVLERWRSIGESRWRRGVRVGVGKVSKDSIIVKFVSYVKEFKIYLRVNGELLKGVK